MALIGGKGGISRPIYSYACGKRSYANRDSKSPTPTRFLIPVGQR
jgi:hypothetical protein